MNILTYDNVIRWIGIHWTEVRINDNGILEKLRRNLMSSMKVKNSLQWVSPLMVRRQENWRIVSRLFSTQTSCPGKLTMAKSPTCWVSMDSYVWDTYIKAEAWKISNSYNRDRYWGAEMRTFHWLENLLYQTL
jgi:hypothetical protein